MIENNEYWLPLIYLGLMGLAMLVYAILDGYDLGIGVLLGMASGQERDQMIASIGPFWDANETWLVLGVGILLVAFPAAHGLILSSLYIPVFIMLIGLILRGIAFDLRTKSSPNHKRLWETAFQVGSLMAALSQGYMLGQYIVGFEQSGGAILFAVISAICVAAAYVLIGACWLVLKTGEQLQEKAVMWAKRSLLLTALGLVSVSAVNPWVSSRIFDKWFAFPQWMLLGLLPVITGILLMMTYRQLNNILLGSDRRYGRPLMGIVGVFIFSFAGLAYSFYPYVVPDQLTVWQASSATASLEFILYGVMIVLPAIIGYTLFSYRVFWGKATHLSYD